MRLQQASKCPKSLVIGKFPQPKGRGPGKLPQTVSQEPRDAITGATAIDHAKRVRYQSDGGSDNFGLPRHSDTIANRDQRCSAAVNPNAVSMRSSLLA